MPNVLAIARRELRAYFDAPVAYIVLVAFLAVTGWMFFSQIFLIDRADVRSLFAPSPFSPSLLLVILAPAVTMRLVAEERKSGTIELLTTLPVTDTQVIVGKFLAALALLAVALAATLAYPITVAFLGPLDWGPVVAGYLGSRQPGGGGVPDRERRDPVGMDILRAFLQLSEGRDRVARGLEALALRLQ